MIFLNNETFSGDIKFEGNDIAQGSELQDAVLRSLFENRRAQLGDVLPEGVTDRQGWWADELAEIEGDLIGSRLWLLERQKNSPDVLARAEEYAREALQWLTTDGVASRVDVTAEFFRRDGFVLTITFHRPQLDPVRFRFGRTWDLQGEL